MHGWYGGWHMGWMAIWWFFGVVMVLVLAMAALRGGSAPSTGRESPEEILKRRYASGEIDRETFQRMLEDLRSQGGRGGRSELRT